MTLELLHMQMAFIVLALVATFINAVLWAVAKRNIHLARQLNKDTRQRWNDMIAMDNIHKSCEVVPHSWRAHEEIEISAGIANAAITGDVPASMLTDAQLGRYIAAGTVSFDDDAGAMRLVRPVCTCVHGLPDLQCPVHYPRVGVL